MASESVSVEELHRARALKALNGGEGGLAPLPGDRLASDRRYTRFQSKAWNHQSIQIFADFNDFESPRGIQSQRAAEREEEGYEETGVTSPIRSKGHARSPAGSICSLDKPLPEPPYHVFTLEKKRQIVYIVSAAAIFSPLSSNIYFPALGQISAVRWWPLFRMLQI